MKGILYLIAFLVLVVPTCSQDFDKTKMESFFSVIESNDKGMGSVSIFKDGTEVYQRSIGFSDVEGKVRSNAQTKYRIGSISKTFTAAMIMQMVDEGKLALDSKLAEFFADVPNANNITIEHLLRHRSGLYNFTNAPDYPRWMEAPITQSELLELFKKNGTIFGPGEKFEYSNTNYVLLSFIIQQIDGKAYKEILKTRITDPLELNNTYYGGAIDLTKNEAFSYTFQDDWQLARETDMSIPLGAGAIISTPTDLNIFYHALFEGRVVSKQPLDHMRSLKDGIGLGLFQIPFYHRKALGHNGGIDGFQSSAAYFTKDSISIAYTSNGAAMAVNDILIGVLSIYFEVPYDFPAFGPALEVGSEDLDRYLGIYSGQNIPLKITITKKSDQLIAQATGQSAFLLEAYEIHKFRFEQAGIKMEFIPDENKMILNQGGARYEFLKEE